MSRILPMTDFVIIFGDDRALNVCLQKALYLASKASISPLAAKFFLSNSQIDTLRTLIKSSFCDSSQQNRNCHAFTQQDFLEAARSFLLRLMQKKDGICSVIEIGRDFELYRLLAQLLPEASFVELYQSEEERLLSSTSETQERPRQTLIRYYADLRSNPQLLLDDLSNLIGFSLHEADVEISLEESGKRDPALWLSKYVKT